MWGYESCFHTRSAPRCEGANSAKSLNFISLSNFLFPEIETSRSGSLFVLKANCFPIIDLKNDVDSVHALNVRGAMSYGYNQF